MINETSIITNKSDRQLLGVSRFFTAGNKGIFDYVPRFGKTITALKVAREVMKVANNATILIIAPNELTLRQWYATINDFNLSLPYKDKLRSFYVTTMNKFVDNHIRIDINYGIIIYDEIHNYTTTTRLAALDSKHVTAEYKLGLTGTMPVGEKKMMITSILPVVDVITEEEAIRNKWISNYIEYNFGVQFTEPEEYAYTVYSNHIANMLTLFKGLSDKLKSITFNKTVNGTLIPNYKFSFKDDYTLIMACAFGYKNYEYDAYISPNDVCKAVGYIKGYSKHLDLTNKYNKMISDNWAPDVIQSNCNKFKVYTTNRNRIMTDSEVKMDTIISLLNEFKNKTTIIFMGSTNSADIITTKINNAFNDNYAICYHSSIESKYLRDENGNLITYKNGKPKKFGKVGLLKYAVEQLNKNKTKVLVTVDALNEGLNIPSINLAITAFGTTNPISHIQRIGRAKTINPDNKDEKVIIINVFFDDFIDAEDKTVVSRDKIKLLERQGKNSSRVVKINDKKSIIF